MANIGQEKRSRGDRSVYCLKYEKQRQNFVTRDDKQPVGALTVKKPGHLTGVDNEWGKENCRKLGEIEPELGVLVWGVILKGNKELPAHLIPFRNLQKNNLQGHGIENAPTGKRDVLVTSGCLA